MAASKINWTKARKDYISDPTLSYMDIAKKYGVAKKTVEQHATKGRWVATRQSLADKSSAIVEQKIVDDLSVINTRHTETYRNLQVLLLTNLNILIDDIKNKQEFAKLNGSRLTARDTYSPTQLNFLGSALRSAIEGERIALGLPTTSVSRVEGKFAVANINISEEQWERITNATDSAVELLRERGYSEQEIEAISSGSKRS